LVWQRDFDIGGDYSARQPSEGSMEHFTYSKSYNNNIINSSFSFIKGGDSLKSQTYLDSIVNLFKEEMVDTLIGIYLHGSMAMGCFNPVQSDIDLLIISKDKQPIETYKKIARKLLLIEEEEMESMKGIELSVILESHLKDFVYPTPFEFHYSAFHRDKYKTDEDYFCGGFEDTDLAAHFVVTYNRGITLYGKPIQEVFTPIDKQVFINSIKSDVDGAFEGIIDNPQYYVLNLCRVLLFLKEAVISSKREGGEWATKVVPLEYIELVDQCLAKYNGKIDILKLNHQILLDFAKYMINEIENAMQFGEGADKKEISMNLYTIKPITEQDVPFLWDMLYESLYVPEGQEPFSRDVIKEPFISKYVEDWGREGDLGYIAINSEGQSIGSITIRYFNEDNKGFGYISNDIPELGMALMPEYRGKGIGTALLKMLFEEMKEMGIEKISLSVDPDNLAAVKLYQRFGFKEVGIVDTSITMVADL
jgi:streptomycin 3"-adenylyltransferase